MKDLKLKEQKFGKTKEMLDEIIIHKFEMECWPK